MQSQLTHIHEDANIVKTNTIITIENMFIIVRPFIVIYKYFHLTVNVDRKCRHAFSIEVPQLNYK